MGRRKESPEKHAVRGNPSKLPEQQIQAGQQATLDLPVDKAANELFEMESAEQINSWLVVYASKLGFIAATDTLLLWGLANAIYDHNKATREIVELNDGNFTYEAESYVNAQGDRDDGEAVSNIQPDGSKSKLIRQHPGVMIRYRARNQIMAYLKEIGLTPGARFSLIAQKLVAPELGRPNTNGPAASQSPASPAFFN